MDCFTKSIGVCYVSILNDVTDAVPATGGDILYVFLVYIKDDML